MVLPDGQPLLNPFDCPLYNLSRTIFSLDSSAIARPVSMVHECGSSCKLDTAVQNIEREQMVTTQCIFRHDWTVTTFFIMCTALYNEFENIL